MNTKEFIKRVKRHAKKTGQECMFEPRRGKGSHGRLHVADRFTTVKDGEFGPGLLKKMLDDLGIDKKEF